jgi:Raf kinase inhibitor-like YbhB/YbcL family protein
MTLTLRSDSFSADGPIPPTYTCEGEDRSPHLAWSGVPEGAQSLALVMDDPDSPDPHTPQRTWVHWVVYDIATTVDEFTEGASGALPGTAKEGVNGWSRVGYGGPCPPIGRHRYFFKLYALDTMLPDLDRPTKDDLVEAMQGHILARGQMMGTYEKQAKSRR